MKKILFVEDNQIYQDVIKEMLSKNGYEVSLANDGEEGEAKVLSEKPDLILTDIMMPKENGIIFLQKLKENPKTKNIPTVVFSNYSSAKDIAKNFGANGFLLKSDTSDEELLKTIQSLL